MDNLTETDVRRIFQEEMLKSYFQLPKIPPHTHDGVNNSKIPAQNIVPTPQILGTIKFTENKTYTLYFNTAGYTQIIFNAIAFQPSGYNYGLINGNAALTAGFQWQPNTTSSVKVGGKQYPTSGQIGYNVLSQSSTNLFVDLGGNYGHADSNYVMNLLGNTGSHVVTGLLQNPTPSSVDFIVTNLLTGWEVAGNFTII